MGSRLGLFVKDEKAWRGMETGYGVEWVERGALKKLNMWFGYK